MMLKRLTSYIKPHRKLFIVAVLLAIGTILAGIGLMTTSGYLISRAAQRPLIVDLFMVTAGVRFFGISRGVVRYFERLLSHDLTFRILLTMRTNLYRKFNAFTQRWLMGRRTGDLLSGVISDVETLQNVYLRLISPAIVAIVVTLLTFAGLVVFDLWLALTTLFFLVVSGTLIPWLAVKLSTGWGKRDVIVKSRIKVFLADRLQGLQDLIMLGQKKNSTAELALLQDELDSIQNRNAGTQGMTEGLTSLLANLAMFSVLIMAIPMVTNGEIRGVWLAALTLGVLSSFEAVQGLANAFIQYEASNEAAERLFSMADQGEHEIEAGTSKEVVGFSENDEIRFEKVAFSYSVENATLSNISFALRAGTATAIVGPTGSGKSTLVNLLLKFWKPDSGIITLNRENINDCDTKQYRQLFGVVAQDAYIFNRSLRENLLIARPNATDIQIRKVLGSVGLERFGQDPDWEPGNQGMQFSGGERQLFAMARTMLKNPEVWIFDEPTANMDVGTERKILNLIRSVTEGKTVLMITHRLVDMDRMDQILVMHNGTIAERGTHHELLNNKSNYYRMYQQQMQVLRD